MKLKKKSYFSRLENFNFITADRIFILLSRLFLFVRCLLKHQLVLLNLKSSYYEAGRTHQIESNTALVAAKSVKYFIDTARVTKFVISGNERYDRNSNVQRE